MTDTTPSVRAYAGSMPVPLGTAVQPYQPDTEAILKRMMKERYDRKPDKPLYDFSRQGQVGLDTQVSKSYDFGSRRSYLPPAKKPSSSSYEKPSDYSKADNSYKMN